MFYLIIAFILTLIAFIFSMVGLGGALLYIPVFKWLGFDFKAVAIPMGLFLNGVTALSSSLFYLKNKMVDLKGSIPMIVASTLGAPVGAYFSKKIPGDTLVLLFSLAMLIAGAKMLFFQNPKQQVFSLSPEAKIFLISIASFFIGFIAGLLGIGGGFLFVPLMLAVGYPIKQAAATCSFIVVFSSWAGFVAHMSNSHFEPQLLIISLLAIVLGSQAGARIMKNKMKPQGVKRLFGVILILVAFKLAWKVWP